METTVPLHNYNVIINLPNYNHIFNNYNLLFKKRLDRGNNNTIIQKKNQEKLKRWLNPVRHILWPVYNLRYSEEVESVEEWSLLDLENSNKTMSAGDGLLLTGKSLDHLGRAKCFT